MGPTLARALALAEQLDRPEHLVSLIIGLFWTHNDAAEHRLALPLAERLKQIGEARNDAPVQMLSCHLRGVTHFFRGEFVAARTLMERWTGLSDPANRLIGQTAVDPYADILRFRAMPLAYLGYIDQARSRMDEALSEGRRSDTAGL